MKFKAFLSPLSWSLYDFANTIYSMNVVSFYFPLWLIHEKGVPEIVYSLVYGGAILLSSFISPFLGALSDLKQSRHYPLIMSTLICIFFTALLGMTTSPAIALCFFFLAHASYVVSLVFYNSMLPEVSENSTPGKICGLGVGVGYIGTVFGLWIAGYFDNQGRQAVFLPTALAFLFFAIPLFLIQPKKIKISQKPLALQIQKLKNHSAPVKWFFLANFLCGDAVHTVILYMAVYAKNIFAMSDEEIRLFFIFSTLAAIAASFFWGEWTSRQGGLHTLKGVLLLWLVIFIFGGIAQTKWQYWLIGTLVGIGLAGTWVSTRVLLLELVPKERVGEYYGFYNLTGKSAAVLGPLWWGGLLLLMSWLGELKYRITLISLSLFILGAFWAIRKVNYGTAQLLHR